MHQSDNNEKDKKINYKFFSNSKKKYRYMYYKFCSNSAYK